jgi:N utilization substance protein B
MTRRELREHCFKLLFCTAFYPKEETAEQIEQYFAEPAEEEYNEETMQEETVHDPAMDVYDGGYVRDKVEKILEKIPELDAEIDKVAKGWTTSRMGREELTILRLALYEMRYEEDVPDKVAINEAVELAKKFGGRDSAPFVNGILAKLV